MSNATNFQSNKVKKNTKSPVKILVLASLYIALSVILKFVFEIYLTPDLRVNFTSVPIILSGITLGPVWGLVVGIVSDLVNFVLKPVGAFPHPGLTLVSGLIGLIPGLVFYFDRKFSDRKIKYSFLNLINFIILAVGCLILSLATGVVKFKGAVLYMKDAQVPWYIFIVILSLFIVYFVGILFLLKKNIPNEKNKVSIDKVIFAVTCVEVIGDILLSAIFISQIYGTPAIFLLPMRIIKAFILIPVFSLLCYMLTNVIEKHKLLKKA